MAVSEEANPEQLIGIRRTTIVLEVGADEGDRTLDILLGRQKLYL